MAGDTTGAFGNFTAENTVTTANIYVGGVTVSITQGQIITILLVLFRPHYKLTLLLLLQQSRES